MADIKAYSVAVGNVNPFSKKSREAVKYISSLEGLLGVMPHYPDGTLLLFESKNAAIIGRNKLNGKGIQTGTNICECYVDSRYSKGGNKQC